MKSRWLSVIFVVVVMAILGASYAIRGAVLNKLDPADSVAVQDTSKPILGYPEITSETIIDGLSNVWDVAFLPDETMLFTERAGTLSSVVNGQKQIIATISGVVARGEGGLMSLAVDPDFVNNRSIYVCYNARNDVRVARLTINSSTTQIESQIDIVSGMPSIASGRHSGCRIKFGADKNLWIGTGDAAIGTNSQDPKSLGGKILRVDRDGKGVQGNLRTPFDSRIYSFGHRNTQGLALFERVQDGSYGVSVEHGSSRDDEVNALVPGNFGWNPVPGYNEAVDMTDTVKYPDAIEALWTSGPSTIATGGAEFVKGSKWQLYERTLWIGVLKDKHIRMLELDESGRKLVNEKKMFENEFGRIRSITSGPDQNIYLTTDNGAGKDAIIKLEPKR